MAGSTSGEYLYTFPCSLGVEAHVVNFSAWCADHDAFCQGNEVGDTCLSLTELQSNLHCVFFIHVAQYGE